MDFSETIAVSDLKFGRCRQLIEVYEGMLVLKVKVISLPYILQFCMFCAFLGQDIRITFTGSLVLWLPYMGVAVILVMRPGCRQQMTTDGRRTMGIL